MQRPFRGFCALVQSCDSSLLDIPTPSPIENYVMRNELALDCYTVHIM